MKKKLFIAAVAVCAFAIGAKAQTNLQTFYDFGRNRDHFTTTLEGFYNDNWGNTFFFIDYDYNAKNSKGVNQAPSGSYMEIARCLNFWQDSALAPLSLQVEYNGLVGVNQNFLFGLDWFVHNADFSNTFNFKLLYKTFSAGASSNVPLQFTFVWGMQDIFGVTGLRFSGFADIWGENVINFMEDFSKSGKTVFISEPQLWYNIGQHMGIPNLHIGTEVELSYDFAGYAGFYARPCIGTKWVF
ncbi:MAG: DUF5020 family protein [Bacteroidales bacterium]|jgi:hypothetical protein|nr:DUF5020 family protein [Bacteroidales bacterium]MBP5796259.1 DUF5020 family protein [Bacteroidales bacterium]